MARRFRIFDITISLALLTILIPVFLVIVAVVRLSSSGPAFFQQERMGKDLVPFTLVKFRSMRVSLDSQSFSAGSSHRVTLVGAALRKTKLDELPQLLNVLRGDMSIVGTRPELEKYVHLFPVEYKQLLSYPPGITSPASIKYRNEEKLLSDSNDPERLYIGSILPEKIACDLAYLESRTLRTDMGLIMQTIRTVLTP